MSNFSKGSEIRKEFLKQLNPFLMPREESSNDYNCRRNDINEDANIESILNGDADLNAESECDTAAGREFLFYHDGLWSKGHKIEMDKPVEVQMLCNIVTVLVSWPEKMMARYDTIRYIVLPEVCKPALSSRKLQKSVSLYNCLDAFLKEEPLGPEHMWCVLNFYCFLYWSCIYDFIIFFLLELFDSSWYLSFTYYRFVLALLSGEQYFPSIAPFLSLTTLCCGQIH